VIDVGVHEKPADVHIAVAVAQCVTGSQLHRKVIDGGHRLLHGRE
jgi:hypothetical protein